MAEGNDEPEVSNGSTSENNQIEEVFVDSIMDEITEENMLEVLKSQDNMFIYLYNQSTLKLEEFKKVEEHA